MKIHIQSDTHIEMGTALDPAVACDTVICCGDNGLISNLPALAKYFNNLRKSAEHVIWVPGNHEFYHSDYDKALTMADKFAKEEGVFLLDEALGTADLELEGVTFWGSTLWTDLNGGDWFVKKKIGHGMNDFYVITREKEDGSIGPFTADHSIDINTRTREQINYDADVIITHHCPIVLEHRRFPLSDITYGFCNTGLEEAIAASKAKYWVYGHTHDSHVTDINGTQVISNQQGYPRKDYHSGTTIYEDSGYDPSLIIEV